MTHPCVALEECCEFLDHIRRPVKESERVNGPYPYFGANGQQGWINDYLFEEPLVLLAEDGGHFSNPERGIAYKIFGKTWVNNHAHVLRPREGIIDVDYLAHALKNKDVRRHLSGSTRDKLTKAGACQIEIPLPPLEEQRRIAAILDRAAKVRRLATESLTATSRTLYESIFSRDILAADHRLARIGDIAMQLPSGYGSDPGRSPLVAPVAKVSNITANGRFHREFESRSFTRSELERLLVCEHDLLVVKSSGSKANILSGKTAICGKDEAGKLVASNFLMRLCIDQSAADPHFVWHILNSKISKDFVKKVAGTTTYPNLKWSTYVDHPIPLPSLSEQRLIRERLDSIDALSHEKGARLAEEAGNLIAVLQYQLIGR